MEETPFNQRSRKIAAGDKPHRRPATRPRLWILTPFHSPLSLSGARAKTIIRGESVAAREVEGRPVRRSSGKLVRFVRASGSFDFARDDAKALLMEAVSRAALRMSGDGGPSN